VSDNYTPTSIGISYFRAIYSGDADYNGSVSGNTEERLVTALFAGPHLSLTKAVSPSVFSQIGEVLYYVLVVTNDGSDNLTGVTISDIGLSNIVSNPAQPANLAPGATLTVTGNHTVTHDDLIRGFVINTAIANGSAGTTDTETREAVRAPSVGGEDGPINKTRVLMPVLGLGLLLVLGGTVITALWLRRRANR
jgi:uncharacterized repeat protein (TIGR01451 family)